MATVVFADLVGSTGIFERLGDETAGHFVTQLTTAMSRTFEQHDGRVVKLLGDGLFVLFPGEAAALRACIAIQKRLLEAPVYPGDSRRPVQMQMGVESGEVIEIEGDCYGDAVNSAARLADLAGADQILASHRVHASLPAELRVHLRSLGPMYLRGKTDATEVFRVDWKAERDNDATVMGGLPFKPAASAQLQLTAGAHDVRLLPGGERVTLGRSVTADLSINDSRVSRVHATVEWRAGHFVLVDRSSFGTWVYMGEQAAPVVLRRTECHLVGHGQIALGCGRHEDEAPLIRFSTRT